MAKKSQKSAKTASKSAQNALKPSEKPLESSKPPKSAPKAPRKPLPVWALLTALVLVVGGGILFMFSVGGVFSPKAVTLDPEYFAATSSLENSDGDFLELLTPDRYQTLIDSKKSFVLFVDQTACVNANRLRDFFSQYIAETGLKPYRMMFSDLKGSPLNDQVKYYPSVVIVKNGQIFDFLDPSADEDANRFNDYDAFKSWLDETIVVE